MADISSYFLEKSQVKEKIHKNENTQIFHYLQTLLIWCQSSKIKSIKRNLLG